MQDGEQRDPAQHVKGPERLTRHGIDDHEPEPDGGADDQPEGESLAQRLMGSPHWSALVLLLSSNTPTSGVVPHDPTKAPARHERARDHGGRLRRVGYR